MSEVVATLREPLESPMFDLGSWLVERRGLMDGNEAAWLDVLAEFDRDQGWDLDGQLSCVDWLMWRTKMARSTAFEKLRIAHQLRRLPEVAAAFAAGEISYSAVRSITRIEGASPEVGLWASEHGLFLDEVVTEVGSGLNAARPRLARLLADGEVARIVVEHRDRLARFGVEHLTAALSAQGRAILVVDPGEVDDDLVRDMTDVLTSFCARLHGRPGARNRALRAITTAKNAGVA